jgi:two-component system response regulator
MERAVQPIIILIAEDDPDDRVLTKEAFEESRLLNEVYFVEDGEELINYLERKGEYAEAQRPNLILLDLNMPKKDGREALKEIKSNPDFRRIPIVVMTTSKAEEDIFRSYDCGASSYITKPVTFEGLVDVIKTLGKYWVEVVELPNGQ